MFAEITNKNNRTKVFILYTKHSNISMRFKEVLRERGNVNSVYVTNVESGKDLTVAINNAKIKPFFGDNHLIVCDNIKEDIAKSIDTYIYDVSGNVYLILTTDSYKTMQILESRIARMGDIEKQKVRIVKYTYLTKARILDMYQYLVLRHGYTIPDVVLKLLFKGYTRNIDAVYELFQMAAQGVQIKNEKQVVDLVGIGNRDIDLVITTLLTCSKGTKRKNANSIKKVLLMLDALEVELGLKTVIQRLNQKIDDYIKIKLLIQQGIIKDNKRIGEIPDRYNEERLQYSYKAIEFLKTTSMRDLVALSTILKKNSYCSDMKSGLLRSVCEVIQ